MGLTKKQYILHGVLFILVAFFGYMLEMADFMNGLSFLQKLVSAFWKLYIVIGGIMFFTGVVKKAEDR
ncbi:hypothetical protein U7210_003006 [Escherichia coli]|nr:hypothetical protein [Escherichia coli]EMB1337559.1 hypothetical protein [Escherichia coli]